MAFLSNVPKILTVGFRAIVNGDENLKLNFSSLQQQIFDLLTFPPAYIFLYILGNVFLLGTLWFFSQIVEIKKHVPGISINNATIILLLYNPQAATVWAFGHILLSFIISWIFKINCLEDQLLGQYFAELFKKENARYHPSRPIDKWAVFRVQYMAQKDVAPAPETLIAKLWHLFPAFPGTKSPVEPLIRSMDPNLFRFSGSVRDKVDFALYEKTKAWHPGSLSSFLYRALWGSSTAAEMPVAQPLVHNEAPVAQPLVHNEAPVAQPLVHNGEPVAETPQAQPVADLVVHNEEAADSSSESEPDVAPSIDDKLKELYIAYQEAIEQGYYESTPEADTRYIQHNGEIVIDIREVTLDQIRDLSVQLQHFHSLEEIYANIQAKRGDPEAVRKYTIGIVLERVYIKEIFLTYADKVGSPVFRGPDPEVNLDQDPNVKNYKAVDYVSATIIKGLMDARLGMTQPISHIQTLPLEGQLVHTSGLIGRYQALLVTGGPTLEKVHDQLVHMADSFPGAKNEIINQVFKEVFLHEKAIKAIRKDVAHSITQILVVNINKGQPFAPLDMSVVRNEQAMHYQTEFTKIKFLYELSGTQQHNDTLGEALYEHGRLLSQAYFQEYLRRIAGVWDFLYIQDQSTGVATQLVNYKKEIAILADHASSVYKESGKTLNWQETLPQAVANKLMIKVDKFAIKFTLPLIDHFAPEKPREEAFTFARSVRKIYDEKHPTQPYKDSPTNLRSA